MPVVRPWVVLHPVQSLGLDPPKPCRFHFVVDRSVLCYHQLSISVDCKSLFFLPVVVRRGIALFELNTLVENLQCAFRILLFRQIDSLLFHSFQFGKYLWIDDLGWLMYRQREGEIERNTLGISVCNGRLGLPGLSWTDWATAPNPTPWASIKKQAVRTKSPPSSVFGRLPGLKISSSTASSVWFMVCKKWMEWKNE